MLLPFLNKTFRFIFLGQFFLALCIYCYMALRPATGDPGNIPAEVLHFVGSLLMMLSTQVVFNRQAKSTQLLAGVLILSIVIELGQYFSPGRVVDIKDMLVNFLGVTTGFLLVLTSKYLASSIVAQERGSQKV